MRVGITTSEKLPEELAAEARAAAAAAGVPFLERRPGVPRHAVFDPGRFDALIVFEPHRVSLVDRDGELHFAAGLAQLRIKQLENGSGIDRLVDLAGFQLGDRVLDCTLGLAADAQVAAWAVGPKGRVVGLEQSLPLYLLARHGFDRLRRPPSAAPIEVRRAVALDYLRRQPTGAFEVVLIDPMFSHPRKASPAFHILRRYADHQALTADWVAEARRVASRAVVLKAAAGSRTFARLGLTPAPGRRGARVAWAVALPLHQTGDGKAGEGFANR